MGSLSNLYISQSYQSLIHLGTDNTASANLIGLQDGLGNSIGVSVNTAGDLYLSGSISASLPQGYALVGNSSNRTIAVATSSFGAPLDSLNAYTQSNNQKWADLGSKSGSWITESETGSFARYDVSNPWSANQTFTNISAVSASFQYVQTIFETASVIYSSGSNQLGDELTDVQTLSGSVKIRGGLLINNLDVTASLNSLSSQTGSYATTGSNTFVGNQTIANGANLNVSGNISLTGDTSRINFPNGTYMLGTPGDYFGVNSDGSSQQFNVGDSAPIPGARNITFRNTTPNGQIIFTNENGGTISLSGSATEIQGVSFIPFSQSLDNRLDVLEVSSSLALYTASFNTGTRNLTFTKGDNTTFSVNIPDQSGSAGDFVTTSSFNAYTASNDSKVNQLINATSSYAISSSVAAVDAAQQAQINALINATSSYAISASVAAVDAAQQAQIDSLINATGSYVTETESGSFLITASFDNGTRNLTFTKGDASTFAVNIPDVSGSALDTGSFVTTSSFNAYTQSNDNRLTNIENTTASLNTSITNINSFTQSANQRLTAIETVSGSWITESESGSFLITGSVAGNVLTFTKGDNTTFNLTVATGSGGGGGSTDTGSLLVTASFNTSTRNITFTKGDASTFNLGGFATTGSNTFVDNQNLVSSSLILGGSGVIQLPNGFSLSGNQSDIAQLSSATSIQFITEPPAGPGGANDIKFINRVSGSQIIFQNAQGGAGNNITFEGGDILFNVVAVSGSSQKVRFGNSLSNSPISIDASNSTFTASLQNGYVWVGNASNVSTAVLASTLGGASFSNPNLNSHSGSLFLIANTFNSGAANFSHISASAQNQANLVFKNNNNNADTIVSGSNNIYVNPAAPTAGFKRFVGTTGNIQLNASNVPQMSGSMAFPITMNNNIFTGNGATMTMRGPVSSSAWTITGNLIGVNANIGSSAANNAEKAVAGVTMNNNILYGVLSLVANKSTHTQSNAIGSNIAMGTMTINANSSSILHTANIANGSLTVNNNFFTTNPTAITNLGNNISTLRNAFTGLGHVVNFSGSGILTTDGRTPTVQDNMVVGQTNILFVGADTANNNAALQSTAIIGFNLIVTGSSDIVKATDIGGGFIGRYNAVDGNRNKSSQTIFAVGTGTSGSAGIVRKTGFLIDSGSNTFVEGTLNVSGSSTLSGSLFIQSGSTLPVSTGSAILTWNATTGQVNQASFSTIISASVSSGEFWSTTTQSGSAGVSGSITFNNSGSFYNVSLVNGTQLQVANAGVYNIQFSAQIETSAGADTVYIWFKKNGTNIGDSASKAVLANNTAQIMTVNILDQASANDYYEIAYQNLNGHATVLAEAASGNIPTIPSVIATVFQIR